MISRRTFLGAAGTGLLGAAPAAPAGARGGRKRLAVITTEWRFGSHAWHMGERFLVGYPVEGRWHRPPLDVVSAYVDQAPAGDLSRRRAEEFGFQIYPTIAEALRRGGDRLAVDAVLLIGEHGDYPTNKLGQKLYPRYEFFKQVTEVFRKDGRAVPVFNDKHLSWKWEWAREMVGTARALGFPLLAGSSLPVTWRMPAVDMPYGAEAEELLCVAFGGVGQDPFRWPRADIANALDNFSHPDHPSQRQQAELLGIPHATFNYWLRHYSPAEVDPMDSFFRSRCGELVLRRIVLAALTTFHLQGACGIRLVGTFLQRAGLDHWVACSRGALHALAAEVESDLVACRDGQQPALAQQMKPKTITLVADEHFHSSKPCLVGLEPVSGFLLVESYRDRRDADTWEEATKEGTAGMPVEVVQMTSDEARALICCAEKGLQAAHSPDLFHGQRDTLKPLLLPLTRPIRQAEKELEKAARHRDKLDTPLAEPVPEEDFLALVEAARQEEAIRKRLEQARGLKEEAVQQVRGVGDDYHPFDRVTGKPVTAEEVGKRLTEHVDKLAEVVAEAGLGEKARQAVNKSRTWVGTLMGCVAWFWGVATARVQELGLSEAQEQIVYEELLAGHYWERAAGRARTAQGTRSWGKQLEWEDKGTRKAQGVQRPENAGRCPVGEPAQADGPARRVEGNATTRVVAVWGNRLGQVVQEVSCTRDGGVCLSLQDSTQALR